MTLEELKALRDGINGSKPARRNLMMTVPSILDQCIRYREALEEIAYTRIGGDPATAYADCAGRMARKARQAITTQGE